METDKEAIVTAIKAVLNGAFANRFACLVIQFSVIKFVHIGNIASAW